MNGFRKWWRDWQRGYSDADAELLRMKIRNGLHPKTARLTKRERNALRAMSEYEIIELAEVFPPGVI